MSALQAACRDSSALRSNFLALLAAFDIPDCWAESVPRIHDIHKQDVVASDHAPLHVFYVQARRQALELSCFFFSQEPRNVCA